eukprot:3535963-Rhodomonas_salina.3
MVLQAQSLSVPPAQDGTAPAVGSGYASTQNMYHAQYQQQYGYDATGRPYAAIRTPAPSAPMVQSQQAVLRVSYAMSGTELGYAATSRMECTTVPRRVNRQLRVLAMRSLVLLAMAMLLRVAYAMSGTDVGYGGTRPRAIQCFCYYARGLARYQPTRGPRAAHAMSGTDIGYRGTSGYASGSSPGAEPGSRPERRADDAVSTTAATAANAAGYAATRFSSSSNRYKARLMRALCDVRYWRSVRCDAMSGTRRMTRGSKRSSSSRPQPPRVSSPISLRACYAISGTGIAYGAISLRACYAISGTDLAYGAISLRACYAMSGTDLAYGASSGGSSNSSNTAAAGRILGYFPTRLLRDVRYAHSVSLRMPGTDLAYGARRICGSDRSETSLPAQVSLSPPSLPLSLSPSFPLSLSPSLPLSLSLSLSLSVGAICRRLSVGTGLAYAALAPTVLT